MKRSISNIASVVKFSFLNKVNVREHSTWDYLKNVRYKIQTPAENSVSFQDGELDIKYTKIANGNLTKQVLHRFIDAEENEITRPESVLDKKAFDYFYNIK